MKLLKEINGAGCMDRKYEFVAISQSTYTRGAFFGGRVNVRRTEGGEPCVI